MMSSTIDINKLQVYKLCPDEPEWGEIFHQMDTPERLAQVFYDVPDGASLALPDFQKVLRRSVPYVVEYAGYYAFAVWLNAFTGTTAQIHFCSAPSFNRYTLMQLARHALEEIFILYNAMANPEGAELKSVYGLIPVFNSKARDFARDVGMQGTGFIRNAVRHEGELKELVVYNIREEEVESWEAEEAISQVL